VYADEDAIGADGRHRDPFLKPDWNPDLATSVNYVGRSAAFRAAAVARTGGVRPDAAGLDNWDLLLRMTSGTETARVRHVPAVLLHTPMVDGSAESGRMADLARRILSDVPAAGGNGRALVPIPHSPHWRIRHALPTPCPRVSIVIPTRNGCYLLRRCLDSIFEKTVYPDFEIVVIDNDSDEPESMKHLASVGGVRNVRVVRQTGDFNYADLVNTGVRLASGSVLVLLNNDTEVISPDWLEELVSQAVRPEIGAVGALMFYRNGAIQHAGVFLGTGGGGHVAGNALAGYSPGWGLQHDRFRHVQNFSAVTGACLTMRKAVFEEVGGLDAEHLPVAFNDVDLCLRLRQRGYRIVWTPHAQLYHEESSSRGFEDTPEKHARFLAESASMRRRWGDALLDDPAYNPNLSLNNNRMELAHPPRLTHATAAGNA
jgi:GT2 family glycosyltransferase